MSIFPHEMTPRAPRAQEGPDHSALGPRGGLSIERPSTRPVLKVTQTFTANTCPDCGDITIAGIYQETGRRVDIEPAPLTDLDEVAAIRDQVPTYNLHPDLQIMRRFITEVRAPTRVDRHAQHTCGKTYGHGSSTRTVIRSAPQPDEPPF
jgi:hypothetical protein